MLIAYAHYGNVQVHPSVLRNIPKTNTLKPVADRMVCGGDPGFLPCGLLERFIERKFMKHLIAVLGILVGVISISHGAEAGSERPGLRETGERVAAALFGNLGGTLQKQIAENGVEAAISFCKAAALPLTDGTGKSFAGVQSVRRIGVRTRNPANRPDAADRAVIEEFLREWSHGAAMPAGQLREVKTDSGKTEWRYYRPIPMAVTCLACHGNTDQIAPSVLAAIQKLYPDDQAIDFQDGDLRGAVVVTFETPAL